MNSTYTGDTVQAFFMIGRPNGIEAPVDGNWSCRVQLLDSERNVVGTERTITEVGTNANGNAAFIVRMLRSEADLMVNTFTRKKPATYYWSAEIDNASIEYRRTVEIEQSVMRKP